MKYLSDETLAAYRDKIADSKRLGHAMMFAGVEDAERLIAEVEAARKEKRECQLPSNNRNEAGGQR